MHTYVKRNRLGIKKRFRGRACNYFIDNDLQIIIFTESIRNRKVDSLLHFAKNRFLADSFRFLTDSLFDSLLISNLIHRLDCFTRNRRGVNSVKIELKGCPACTYGAQV